jgi:5'(3')-deoxyribonucleotidase
MPQLNKYCVVEKVQWLNKYLPFIDSKHIHFTANKGLMANPDRILYDDNIEHLESWENSLGIGIAYSEMEWSKEWKGYQADNWKLFYELVHCLQIAELRR